MEIFYYCLTNFWFTDIKLINVCRCFVSYKLQVWMITIIGTTLGIPDTVMGLTFVGKYMQSIRNDSSSMRSQIKPLVFISGWCIDSWCIKFYGCYKGRLRWHGGIECSRFECVWYFDMSWIAVANSNNDYRCWRTRQRDFQRFVEFCATTSDQCLCVHLHYSSLLSGLTYSTISLLSTVVFLLLSVHLNGWKLDKRLGIILMVWYFLFIALASMYELNVFGNFNPPQCPSKCSK